MDGGVGVLMFHPEMKLVEASGARWTCWWSYRCHGIILVTDDLGRYYDDDDAGVMVDKTWMNDKSNWGRYRNYMFVVMTIVTLTVSSDSGLYWFWPQLLSWSCSFFSFALDHQDLEKIESMLFKWQTTQWTPFQFMSPTVITCPWPVPSS